MKNKIDEEKFSKSIPYVLWSSATILLAISSIFSAKTYILNPKSQVQIISDQWEKIKITTILDKITKWCFEFDDENWWKIVCKNNLKNFFPSNYNIDWYKIIFKENKIIFSKKNIFEVQIFDNNYKIVKK